MSERNLRKTRVGIVVSDKMDKTVVVAIADNVRHPLYKKIGKKTVKLKGAKTVSNTQAKLKKKTYWVRLRSYKTVSGKTIYSSWSKVKKVAIKK